jgi:hypothetical protein
VYLTFDQPSWTKFGMTRSEPRCQCQLCYRSSWRSAPRTTVFGMLFVRTAHLTPAGRVYPRRLCIRCNSSKWRFRLSHCTARAGGSDTAQQVNHRWDAKHKSIIVHSVDCALSHLEYVKLALRNSRLAQHRHASPTPTHVSEPNTYVCRSHSRGVSHK